MARYKVILAYDGAEFFGFQRLAHAAERTVQSEVEAALKQIGWPGGAILTAGRTDRGVHAAGQVIAFDLDWQHSPQTLVAALNAHLPRDVAARSAQEAAADFHPRYAARRRCYRYRLFCRPERDPLRERYAWRVWPAVDPERLHRSAELLLGVHDFSAFGNPPKPGGVTLREVYRAEWLPEPPDGWAFEIDANAFLYHMVRRLVGFQTAVGQGRFEPQAVIDLLNDPAQGRVQQLAPPNGLVLLEVVYDL